MSTPTLPMSATARCRNCAYSLFGLPSRVCPECGCVFDPSNPTTFVDPAEHRQSRMLKRVCRWRKWATPPSGRRCLVVVISTAYLIAVTDVSLFVLAAEPHSFAEVAQDLLHLIAVVILAFTLRDQVRAVYSRRRLKAVDTDATPQTSHGYTSRVALVCCLAGVLMAFSSPMLALRFALSGPALEAAARRQLAYGTSVERERPIGLFLVNGIYLHNGGQVFFNLSGVNGWVPQHRRFGLLYEPNGRGWGGVHRHCLLNATWSVAGFASEQYTLFEFAFDVGPGLFLPRLSR